MKQVSYGIAWLLSMRDDESKNRRCVAVPDQFQSGNIASHSFAHVWMKCHPGRSLPSLSLTSAGGYGGFAGPVLGYLVAAATPTKFFMGSTYRNLGRLWKRGMQIESYEERRGMKTKERYMKDLVNLRVPQLP